MIIITLALIMLAACGIFLQIKYSDNFQRFGTEYIGIMMTITAVVLMIPWSIVCIHYVAAEHKALLINREYGTNYTREDVFYASDVIDKIREIKRTRIELNGNICREK